MINVFSMVTDAWNYEEIKWDPESVYSNIKPFINKYKYSYPSKRYDWKTFEKNNPTIALNISHIRERETSPASSPAYKSKFNSNCEKQTVILMIPNEEKEGWHSLPVRKISTLLHGITPKHKGDFYSLNFLYSFITKMKMNVKRKIFVEL